MLRLKYVSKYFYFILFAFHNSSVIQLNSDDPYYAEPIDVWGVGVILFTLLVGSMCFFYFHVLANQD